MKTENQKLQTSLNKLNQVKKESYRLLKLSYTLPIVNMNKLYKQVIKDQIKILRPIEL